MRKVIIAAAFVATPVLQTSAEPTHSYLTNKNHLYVGTFSQTMDANILAQRDGFDPVSVGIEDVGIGEEYTSGLLEYSHRFNSKWGVNFGAYEFANSRRSVSRRDFNYDGVDFEAGVGINSELTIRTYILDAMYSVYDSDSTEIEIGAGLHMLDNEASIQLVAGLDGEVIGATQQAKSSVLAPLPNLRASAFHAFNDDWSVHATMGWLSANIDNIDGDFLYFNVRGQYQLSDRWGLSLGYKFVEVDVLETIDNGVNGFDLSFEGVSAAVSYNF